MSCPAFRIVGALAAALICGAPLAQQVRDSAADVIDFGDRQDPQELKLELPPAPKNADLARFDPGKPSTLEFFIDTASLRVGDDQVVRYTMVAKSNDGASNVSYEGMRCRTRERKVYAYGRADGSWSEIRDPQWVKIGGLPAEPYRFALYEDYFCPARLSIRSAGEGVDALKRGRHPRASDFTSGDPMRR